MIVHKGSSSSLSYAMMASRKLAVASARDAGSARQHDAAPFIAFRAPGPRAAPGGEAAAEQRPVRTTPPPPAAPPESFANWDDMLLWCLAAAQAKTAFVTDAQGFVIAKQGGRSYEDAEAMGTQLMVAMERLDEVDSFGKRALSISVKYHAFWMVGVRVDTELRERFTLGLVSASPVAPDSVDAIAAQVEANVASL